MENYYNLDPTKTQEKVSNFPAMIISVLFILIIILSIFLVLEFQSNKSTIEDSNIVEGESLPLQGKSCRLESLVKQNIKASEGEKIIIEVSGFQGDLLEITWEVKDLLIASTNLFRSDLVTVTAHNEGKTEIIATDTSVGDDCTINTFLTVTSNEEETIEAIQCDDNDFNCLIEAADDCNKAELFNTATLDLFGILTTTTTFYEIDPFGNECNLFLSIEEQTIEYSEELIELFNLTEEEIEASLAEANEFTEQIKGRNGECLFQSNNDLEDLLEDIESGSSTSTIFCDENGCELTGAWEEGECTGEYFEPLE